MSLTVIPIIPKYLGMSFLHFSMWFLFAYVMWFLRLEFPSWPHLLALLLLSHSALKMELMLPQSIPEWWPELQRWATTMTAGVPTVQCSHLLHLMFCSLFPAVNLWVKARIHASLFFSVSSRDPQHRTCFQSILLASTKIQKYVLYLSPAKETVSTPLGGFGVNWTWFHIHTLFCCLNF